MRATELRAEDREDLGGSQQFILYGFRQISEFPIELIAKDDLPNHL